MFAGFSGDVTRQGGYCWAQGGDWGDVGTAVVLWERGEPRWEAGLDGISQQGELILKCEFGLCFVNTRSH